MVKIATRSTPDVRLSVYAAMTEIAEALPETSAMLDPLIRVVDEQMALLAFFDSLGQARPEDVGMGVSDPDMMALQFSEMHEKLKERLAVYVRLSEFRSFKLLGQRSNEVLKHAQEIQSRRRSQRAAPAAAPKGQLDDILFPS